MTSQKREDKAKEQKVQGGCSEVRKEENGSRQAMKLTKSETSVSATQRSLASEELKWNVQSTISKFS